jgi:hypothetical protein
MEIRVSSRLRGLAKDETLQGRLEPWLVAALGALLLLVYAAIFLPLLPDRDGSLGHDYSMWLPYLLAGYFWFHENGLWAIPWFTPGFCGGIPYLPNPQMGYYSLPQFLTFVVPPVTAVRASLLIFAVLGYAGFYLLARRSFKTGAWAAVLGAALFMFNGFHAHRMLIGHLTFHGFMLMPLAAWFILPGRLESKKDSRLGAILGGGLVFAYMFHSGAVHLIPVAAAAIAGAAIMLAWLRGWSSEAWLELLLRSGAAVGLALSLSAARLVATIAYVRQFPRDLYPLPGMSTVWDMLVVVFQSLFFGPAHELAAAGMVNFQWRLNRHEFEFGVTFFPLLLLLAGLVWIGFAWVRTRPALKDLRPHVVPALALLAIFSLPIILNWYTPAWNLLLKQVPFIKSSTNLFRWIAFYIPLVILASVLAFDRLKPFRRVRPWLALGGVAVVVFLTATADRTYYARQGYKAETIEAAYERVRAGRGTPRIDRIIAFVDDQGRFATPIDRNDSLIEGGSQALCYDPIFGYRLEAFPFKSLRPGPVTDVREGALNIKNPACFVYPTENNCRPGDHYAIEEEGMAKAFVNYRPVDFSVPLVQELANWLNLGALGVLPFLLGFAVLRSLRGRRRRTHGENASS